MQRQWHPNASNFLNIQPHKMASNASNAKGIDISNHKAWLFSIIVRNWHNSNSKWRQIDEIDTNTIREKNDVFLNECISVCQLSFINCSIAIVLWCYTYTPLHVQTQCQILLQAQWKRFFTCNRWKNCFLHTLSFVCSFERFVSVCYCYVFGESVLPYLME